MIRHLLGGLLVCLAVAAPSAAGEVPAATEPVAGSYIVVFKADAVRSAAETLSKRPLVAPTAQELARAQGSSVNFVYQHALKGFAARLSPDRAEALASDPRVAYVEPDQVVHAVETQSPATWGLDRIDQRDLPLNNTYTYNQTGQGVHAYIIDTGVRATHQEFSGRMGNGADFVGDGNGTNDCHGHGTHVAGTTGGTTYGVAKLVTLHAVRVLNCQGSGTTSGVIAGVDWVTANSPSPAVANMSLGGGVSTSLDNAVCELDQLRRQLRDRRGQLERQRLQLLARARSRRQHSRIDDEHRRSLLVLELRDVRGHLRAGLEHHVGLEHQQHRDEHHQRNLDGDAARGRRDRSLPRDRHWSVTGDSHGGARRELDHGQGLEPRLRVTQPAAVLGRRRLSPATASASAATSTTAPTAARR